MLESVTLPRYPGELTATGQGGRIHAGPLTDDIPTVNSSFVTAESSAPPWQSQRKRPVETAALIVVLVIALALFFDFTNGFHDTANAMATPIATGALKPKTAVLLAAVLNLVGAFLSTEVAKTVSGGIIREDSISEMGAQVFLPLIFAGLIGRDVLGSGATQEQAIEALRAQGETTQADMIASMTLTDGVDFSAVADVLLLVLAVYVAASLLAWLGGYLLNDVVQGTVLRMRSEVEDKVHRLPLGYFDKQPRGELLSRVTNDIDNVSQALQQTMSQLVNSLFTVVGGTVAGAETTMTELSQGAEAFRLAARAARALRADLVGIELVRTATGWLVWDAVPVPDFRAAVPVGDVPVATAIASIAAARVAEGGDAPCPEIVAVRHVAVGGVRDDLAAAV